LRTISFFHGKLGLFTLTWKIFSSVYLKQTTFIQIGGTGFDQHPLEDLFERQKQNCDIKLVPKHLLNYHFKFHFLSSIVHIESWHTANEHYACKNISFLASMFNIVFVWLKRHQRDEELLSTQHFRHSYQQSWQDLGSFCFLNKQTFLERHFFPKEWIHCTIFNAKKLNTYHTIKQSISKKKSTAEDGLE